jgi:hypothetical protein
MILPADAPPWAHEMAQLLTPTHRSSPHVLARFSRLDLPQPSQHRGALIFVSDAAGGAVPAFSDGAVWRRCDDSTIVT